MIARVAHLLEHAPIAGHVQWKVLVDTVQLAPVELSVEICATMLHALHRVGAVVDVVLRVCYTTDIAVAAALRAALLAFPILNSELQT